MSQDTDRATPKPPSVDRLSLLWRRINDHKIVQWSIAYVALAYGIQHGVVLTGDAFEWPHAVQQISMLLLALGLPVTMTFAWYHGDRATRHISGPELTIITILLVIGSMFFYVLVRPSETIASRAPEGSVAAARSASLNLGSAISVAVLPFVNLSSDTEQEFFSDGMTEEITAALAKVPSLRVVGRTSAFQFKGENKDLRAIGQSLGASHLIEGSVRKDGNQVRITAQLIKADDGTHLWTESYDRELKGIFVVQEDIAQAIVVALRVPLGLKQGDTLVRNRTDDLESYQQYLRGRSLVRARAVNEAIEVLESVVVRDPGYAPAWALLARAYGLVPTYSLELRSGSLEAARRVVETSVAKGEKAAAQAIRLDSRNAFAYAAFGYIEAKRGKWLAAEDHYKQALSLDPNDPEVLHAYGTDLATAGRFRDSLSTRERLKTLEPFVPIYNIDTAEIMQFNGQSQESIPILEQIPADAAGGYFRNVVLARAYALTGRYAEAADTLLAVRGNSVSRRSVEDAAQVLRQTSSKVATPKAVPSLEGELNFVYAYVGTPNRIFEYPERLVALQYAEISGIGTVWSPELTALRKMDRFKALMRNIGLVDYWRARGWPDLCHPVGANDFACE